MAASSGSKYCQYSYKGTGTGTGSAGTYSSYLSERRNRRQETPIDRDRNFSGSMLGSGVTPGFRNPAVNKLALRHLESQDIDSKEDEQNHGQEESTEKPALQNKREMFFKNDHSNHIQAQSGVNKEGGNKDNQALYGSTPVQNAKEALFQHQHQNQHASNQSSHKEQPAVKKEEKNHQMNHHPPPPPPSHNQEESEREKPVVRDRDKEKERDRREKEEKGNISVPKCRELEAYVGFAILPDQVYRKAVKRGFEFTLMVVGESGTGKSTLLNSMFMADIYSPEYPGPSHRIKKTVQVEATKVLLKEKGVHLSLTLVDTPGFGDAVNNSNCWQPIVDYIDSHYEEYLNNESRVSRKKMPDNRVHCCLYFIAPTGHGLKPLDVEFMKRLHEKVNLVPVIAKADTFTSEECHLFKKQIMLEIRQHKIKIYEFPEGREEEERVQKPLRDRVPFAVVGSNAVLEVDGRKVRGRKYPWGLVEVENLEHCDFLALRNMLVCTHMMDLLEVTNNVHYENYRCQRLSGIGSSSEGHHDSQKKMDLRGNKNPLAQMEEEKKEHEKKMKQMEIEMEQVFEMKVQEKKQKMKDVELDLQRKHEERMRSLEAQEKELEERRRAFEIELKQWETANGVTMEELRRRSLEANSKETVDGKEKGKKKKGLF